MNLVTLSGSLCLVFLLSACSHLSNVDNKLRQPTLPEQWLEKSHYLQVQDNWLSEFNYPELQQLVAQALRENHGILQQAYQVEIEAQRAVVSGATLLPSLDLSVRNSRTKNTEPTSYQTSSNASLTLSYEVDVWGKLSTAQQQANLTYLSQKASFEQAKQQLVADVIVAWFEQLSAKKLFLLYQARVTNAEQSLDIIEKGYQQGLNEALDVYLARNNLNSERSRLAQQSAIQKDSVRNLERLIGQYPEGKLHVDAEIPLITDNIPAGIPSELITRKPQLVASWYQLLAFDSALAYAHKQRFPSLNLNASLSESGDNLGDVFSPSHLAWSLIGSISAPLFQGGRLKANENIALLNLKQSEQQYLDILYEAFNTVESAISQEISLKDRYQAILAARDNAIIAEQLSFEQYRNGLVTYTTALDAQGRSYDAQSALIELKNQLIVNRVNLHLALGGDFSISDNTNSEN